ncbi:eukaryotic translation initiation factor 2 subunit alpha [Planoprotostelium fungivorum]|uniref:Eukaryotic translation initiation factor 2 subunit alpha n=1 Tax=Planoprotostelium fungivorum TaxID=1890364 RepID=A0A2P6MXR6_9EUKA|nr:eukaryotic translation initiation factor 2 subunit alpha [Planoprotostelium fungivorum]
MSHSESLKQHEDASTSSEINLNCRMYEQKYPEVDQLVMTEVVSVEDMGAHVLLKEYNNAEGMIMLSELSRQRIRSINKIIRVGRKEAAVVLRVDKEKGYIDLSKRRISEEETARCVRKYNKSVEVQSILRRVAEQLVIDLEELYVKVGWPLNLKFGHAYDAFRLAILDEETVFKETMASSEMREAVMTIVRHRLTPTQTKVRADIEITCFRYEGIDAIKEALREGEKLSTESINLKIKLVAPPHFVIFCSSLKKEEALKAVGAAVDAIREAITQRRGGFNLKTPPRLVEEREEKEFSRMLNKLKEDNTEVGPKLDGCNPDKSAHLISPSITNSLTAFAVPGEVNTGRDPRLVEEREEKEFSRMLNKLKEDNTEVPGDDDISDDE